MRATNRPVRGCAAFILIALLCGTLRADNVTREITSNNILALAGHGDTIWLLTSAGVNFTIAKSAAPDSLVWWGLALQSQPWALAFGAAGALSCLGSNDLLTPNNLLFYNHAQKSFFQRAIGWDRTRLPDSLKRKTYLAAVDAAFCNGYFYLACLNGGVVRYDPRGDSCLCLYPGINKRLFTPAAFPPEILPVLNDSASAILGVAGRDSGALWAMGPEKIWRLTIADTAWDSGVVSLPFPQGVTSREFAGIFVSPATALLYAAVIAHRDSGAADTQLYVYDTAAQNWNLIIQTKFAGLTFGLNRLYILHGNSIEVFSDALVPAPAANMSSADFLMRITKADTAMQSPTLTCLAFSASGADTFFWIGSNDGLFFSANESADETAGRPFSHVKRALKITGNLQKTYAVPGILTQGIGDDSRQGRAFFAYNLTTPASITIRVYDWNMHCVKTVIKDQPRPAGRENVSGRSTDERYDVWDGSDGAGKPAPVGVYYYKISASTGQSSFGRIVVAK